jgi:putative ABC transport system permease protein
VRDLGLAVRLLARDRRFTVGAVLALALGISVNNMVFTFVNAVLLREWPLAKPEQLVALGARDTRGRDVGVSFPDLRDWIDGTRDVFSDVVATTGGDMNLSDEHAAPERHRGVYYFGNAFRMYGIPPLLGRSFTADDEQAGAAAVVILNERLWRNRYGGDREIVGRTIRVNGVPSTVVGIVPATFRSPFQHIQVLQPLLLLSDLPAATRDARVLSVDARLRDGVSVDQATAALSTIGVELARRYPNTNTGITTTIDPMSELHKRDIRPTFTVLMIAVGFVLLIACANVANLLLARSADRAREIAVRVSVGATRWQIVRQLLIESIVLAFLGGLLGLVLSLYEVRVFSNAFEMKEVGGTETFAPFWLDLSMDWRVFGFLAALCLGSSILFGLAPALHVSKSDVQGGLKDGGRGTAGSIRTRKWVNGLVVGQLVLALVLLTGAGLLVRSTIAAYRTSLAFDTSNLMTMRLTLPKQMYGTPDERRKFLLRLEDELRGGPGGLTATLVSNLPFVPGGTRMHFSVDPESSLRLDQPLPVVTRIDIGPRYFETLRVPLLRGRSLDARDAVSGQSSVVINQRLASVFFPDADPLGQRIYLTDPDAPARLASPFTVVGISPTVPQYTFPPTEGKLPDPVVYVPFHLETAPEGVASIIVRGTSGASTTAASMREVIRALDPDLPLYFMRTMDDVADEVRFQVRTIGLLFGLVAAIAFALASIGLYGVTARTVTHRIPEIGIRMALGAKRVEVMWLVLRRALIQIGIGLLVGVAGALSLGIVLRGFLIQTSARDPLTLFTVCLLLVVVSLGACAVPAWRAARLNPIEALRHE